MIKQQKYTQLIKILDANICKNSKSLQKVIKYFLTLDAINSGEDDICVSSDLKKLIGLNGSASKVLTDKQKIVVKLHLIDDVSQSEIASKLGISQQGVSIILKCGMERIRSYLVNGSLKWTPWSPSDKEYLMSSYGHIPIETISKVLNRPSKKITSMYYFLRNLKGSVDDGYI